MFRIVESEEYVTWFNQQSSRTQAQIHARIARILNDEHFGVVRKLNEDLAELKWHNGRRIYFSIYVDETERVVILLLGGNKNSQKGDIQKAQNILRKLYEEM